MLSLILAALLPDPVAAPVVLPSQPAPLHGILLAPGVVDDVAGFILRGER